MLKNMQISTRLILSYMLIIIFMVITGVVSIVSLSSVGDALSTFYTTSFRTVESSYQAKRSLVALRADLLQATLEDNPVQNASYVSDARQDFQDVKTFCAALETTYAGDRSNLTTMNNIINQISPMLEQLYVYASNNDQDRGYDYLTNTYLPLGNQLRQQLDLIGADADQRAEDRVSTGNSTARTAEVVQIVDHC